MKLLNEELMHLSKVVAASVHMNFDKFLLLVVSVHSALSNSYCNLYYTFDSSNSWYFSWYILVRPCLLRYC